MYLLMAIVFILGYVAIALEHKICIDKSAPALLIGVLCWTLLVIGADSILVEQSAAHGDISHYINHQLAEHLSEISSILFFLLGAMTIVELIDSYGGFSIITDKIQTTHKVKLIWILSILTFFLSAALDNLTTSIVMAALLRKLIDDKKDLWFFAGIIIIAANAGGAWSPIGDVTTIMLWIGGQVSAQNIVLKLFLPSLVALLVPLSIVSFTLKGNITRPKTATGAQYQVSANSFEKKLIFFLGVGSLLFVPIFKTLTHLPPFMGILFGLGVLWLVTEILNQNKVDAKEKLSIVNVLTKIDVPSVLFFLGILLAVAALQTAGHLTQLASLLDTTFGNVYVINIFIGLLSSIVDNVPLVAGAMGMYSLDVYPSDNMFWELLAYCAGTGGSALIIGSAAGVAIMGILKIDFIWYMKKISWLALIGYFSGALAFYLQAQLIN
ncbi:MAG: Na+/H+ antiporter NhaD/arsenite permease-like protein [Aureispira sp.]|jgi:Na+/H+ antiporter NhaD/arsenite permease-like protein